MGEFTRGDRVRIDIPEETDPDHEQYHGREGEIIEVLVDEVDVETGDRLDADIYRVELDGGTTVDVRWRDLRPSLHDE